MFDHLASSVLHTLPMKCLQPSTIYYPAPPSRPNLLRNLLEPLRAAEIHPEHPFLRLQHKCQVLRRQSDTGGVRCCKRVDMVSERLRLGIGGGY